MMNFLKPIFYLLLFAILCSCTNNIQKVRINYNPADAQVLFAINHIERALKDQGIQVSKNDKEGSDCDMQIHLLSLKDSSQILPENISISNEMHKESFSIRKIEKGKINHIYVIGGESAGAMYGGLDIAEQIKIGKLSDIQVEDQKPYMNMRGIKFNIPLDVRTPSYTDVCDAAQENIPEMWSMDFWTECIDNLALHRYNFISLWSMHPFPSMIKVPDYPDIALDDVHRSTIEWDEYYSGLGLGFASPEILENVEIVKKISIEEKIMFWQEVMLYAKERNIDFYVVTWNIFDYGTQGKYGITDDINNPVTKDYFRKSVKQMFLSYPDLKGIGLTTGENIPHSYSSEIKEKWAFDTYGQGIIDAAKEMPGRKMTLLHRQHWTGTKKIADQFQPLVDHPDIDFLFSFKYAKAHVHSSTVQPYHHEFVNDITNSKMRTIWTLRNDDTFYLRWGAPDFVREFIKNIPLEVSEGWYLGSDQWIWGREFLSKYPKSPREIELKKHWYHWMIWGRLGYNPNLGNERFKQVLQASYPEVESEKLFNAWQEASMVYPKTTAFHWGMFDFQWYIEGCKGRPHYTKTKTGFHDVNFFIELPPLSSTNYLSIPGYVKRIINKEVETDSITPFEIADQIHQHAEKALATINDFSVENDELVRSVKDIRIMSHMGKYYAFKIEGATNLELYRQTNDTSYQNKAIERLNRAAEQWRMYASLGLSEYTNPLWTNRVGHVNWREFMTDVLKDIEIAGGTPQLNNMEDTKAGFIVKAPEPENSNITWTFEAQSAGSYYAEIKYACDTGIYQSTFFVNNSKAADFTFWSTGGKDVLGWDRERIKLVQGENKISIKVPENSGIKIVQLNIL